MPKINIFLQEETDGLSSAKFRDIILIIYQNMEKIKKHLAKKLSCTEMNLSATDISIRVLTDEAGNGMLKPVEVDIIAYNFPSRVARKDEISLEISKYFQEEIFHSERKPDVMLILSELGTS
jgi:hypothetical protein